VKTWIKVIGGIGVLLIATLVSGIVVLKSMDFNRFKDEVQTLLQDATGRELIIAGDLDLATSLTPTLTVTNVTFANADWATAKAPMVALKRLDAQIALRPLLSGVLDVEYIVLDGLDVVLESDGKGRANWEFETTNKTETVEPQIISIDTLALDPQVRDVRLRNVHVTYRDGATGAQIETDLQRVDFTADSMDSPLIGVIEATYNAVDIEAHAKLGSFGQLIGTQGPAFPVNLKIAAPGLSADIIGSVEQPSAGMAVNARVSLSAQDTTTLSKLAATELPPWNAVTLRTNISGGGTAYSFKGLDAKIGNSDFQGNVDIELGGQRPRVVAKLSSNILYANEIANFDSASPQPKQKRQSFFTKEPLPFEQLKMLDADVRYTAKRITAEPIRLTDVKADMTLKDAKLSVNPLRLTMDGGRIIARAMVDGSGKTPQQSIRASVRGLDVGMLTTLAGFGKMVTIKLDGEVNLKGTGDSTQKIMGGLNGSTNFIGRNGQIHNELFKDLTEGVGGILPWASNKDANVITCVMAKLPITNGDAVAETAILDTSGVLVNVTGNVDLGGERLHLTLHTDAKTASLASFAVPVRIKGSFVAPRVDVDPGEAVVGTVENIVKAPAELIGSLLGDTISLIESKKEKQQAALKDDPCIQVLSGGKSTKTKTKPKNQTAPPPQKKPVDASKSTGDPVKDVKNFGKALQNIF